MIQKITTGRGFRGALNYVLREGKEHEKEEAHIIGSNMEGENARELAAEFGALRSARPELERAVHHASLRLPDDEHLTREQWEDVAQDYLKGMGFDNSPWVAVDHDNEHNHIHIIASRIDYEGNVVSDSHERYRSQDVVREIEDKYHLRHAYERDQERDQERDKERNQERDREPEARLSITEKEIAERTGEIPPKVIIAEHINEAINRSDGTREDFTRELKDLGVETHWNESPTTGRVHGASYELENYQGEMANRVQGRQIGPDYSWTNISDRLQEREREIERERAAQERAEIERERAAQEQAEREAQERAAQEEAERVAHERAREREQDYDWDR